MPGDPETYIVLGNGQEKHSVSYPHEDRLTVAKRRWVLVTCIMASSMAFIDSTVVNVAMPSLQASFNGSASQLQWVVEAYALFLTAFLLVGGSIGDRYGRRLIFSIGTVLFTLGSIACGLSGSILVLIFARAFQGCGAALLIPGSLSILTSVFPRTERGKAIGTWSAFSAITTAVGPVLGGWLVDHGSWRWVFFINVPIGALVLLFSFTKIPESRNASTQAPLDWAGAVLVTMILGSLVAVLIEGSRHHLVAILGVPIFLVSLSALIPVEKHNPAAMLPLNLLRSRTFVGANLLTLLLYTSLGGLLFFLPLNLIQVQHYSATRSGLALLPMVLLIFLLSRWTGELADRFGARWPLVAGSLIAAAGFALAARPGVSGSYWSTFFPVSIVLGFGMALSAAPLTTTVMGSVPDVQSGAASGLNNAISRLAALLAVAILGLVLTNSFQVDLRARLDQLHLSPTQRTAIESQRYRLAAISTGDPITRKAIDEAFIFGFRRVMWIASGLAFAGACISAIFFLPQVRRDGAKASG